MSGINNEIFTIQHSVSGNVSVANSVPFLLPFDAELVRVDAVVGTAPASTAILIDVNKNGTTIYSDQADRVTIAVGETEGSSTPDIALANGTNYIYTPAPSQSPLASYSQGDVVRVDVDQVGTGTTGANLGVILTFLRK